MTPRTWTRSSLLCANKPSTSRPSSSEVRSRTVCSRQAWTSDWPSNTPRTILVLPTSIASSIRAASSIHPVHFTGDDPLDRVAAPDQQRAVQIDPDRLSGDYAVSGGPTDERAARRRRLRAPAVENSIEPAGEQVVVTFRQSGQRLGEHVRAID